MAFELTERVRQSFWLSIAIGLGVVVALLPLRWLVALTAAFILTAVLLAIFVQPLIGLALALLAGPFGALENVILGGNVPLDSGQILLFVTLLAWLFRGLARRRIIIPQVSLFWPLVLFTAVMALTLFDAPALTLGITELLKWIEIVVVMVIAVDLISEWQTVEKTPHGRMFFKPMYLLLAIILLSGVTQALIGIWQFALRGHGPEHFLVLGRFYRAYGTFEQPNPFGGYMGLNGALAVGSFVGLGMFGGQQIYRDGWQFIKKLQWRVLFLFGFIAVCALLISVALVMSWSRGAWLGYAAALVVIAFFWPKRQWQGVVLLVIGAFLFFAVWQTGLVPTSISTRLTTVVDEFRLGDVRGVDINDNNYAVLERLAFWQAAVEMAQENIWLGVGFGNYAAAYPDYALINWPTALGHAHNYYLNLFAEGGIGGITAYALVWMIVLWQNMVLLRRLTWPGRGIALGLLGAWVALTVHQAVDKLYVNNIYVHIGAMFGLQQYLLSAARKKDN